MMDTDRIRVAGVYSGPGYGTRDPRDGFEGFTSIGEARDRFQGRLATGGGYPLPVRNLTVNRDNMITAVDERQTRWPGTTAQDTLELYRVFGGEVAAEPFAKLSAGTRGGVAREDY